MCGFAGWVGPGTSAEADLTRLHQMGAVLAARGPDDETVTVDRSLHLVFRRLAVNDIEGGAQPFRTPDGRFTVAVNGEIYNHRDLARQLPPSVQLASGSDCEVVLHLFQQHGTATFSRLNGMFAIAVWDAHERVLVLARDRLGIKPLYTAPNGTGLSFASELRALLVDLRVAPERNLDWPAFRDLPTHEYPYQRPSSQVVSTGVAGVSFVEPGTFVVCRPGRAPSTTRYWEPPAADATGRPATSYVEEYGELLADSVRLQLMSDVPIGVALSGGVDSATVAAMAVGAGAELEAFTLVEPAVDAAGDPGAAREVARHLGLPLHQVAVDAATIEESLGLGLPALEELVSMMDFPVVDPEIIFKRQLHRYVATQRPHTKVVLIGQGADEFAGGYSSLLPPSWAEFARREEVALRRARARDAGVPDVLAPLVSDSYVDAVAPGPPPGRAAWQTARLGDLVAHSLWHEDRTAAASGRENRVPYLDHRLVELLCTIPASLHADLLSDKRILRWTAARLLPLAIAERPKTPLYDTRAPGASVAALMRRLADCAFPEFRERYLRAPDPLFDEDRLAEIHEYTARPDASPALTDLLLRCMALEVFHRSCRLQDAPTEVAPVTVVAAPATGSKPLADLPDLAGAAVVDEASWRAFGERLATIGFTTRFCAGLWTGAADAYPWLHRPMTVWRAQRTDTAAAAVFRLFCLGAAEPVATVRGALGAGLADVLARAGVLVPAVGDALVSVLDLRILDSMFLLCDRLEAGGDAVFGLGEGNSAFRGAISERWPATTVAEIGCGAGAVALVAARHARQVVATDVNPRALVLARINAAVNGLDNLELRAGDLLTPLGDQCFDLITAQPPFVPQPAESAGATYLYGGASGGELLRRLFPAVSRHLTPTGRAVIVYEAPLAGDADLDPWTSLEPDPRLRALRLVGSPTDPDVYATRHALPWLRDSEEPFDAVAERMRTHLDALGITGIRPAVAVFERTTDGAGWTETIPVRGYLWDSIGAASLWRLLRGVSAARNGVEAAVGLPPHTLVVEPGDGGAGPLQLVLPGDRIGLPGTWTRDEVDSLRRGGPMPHALRDRALRSGLLVDDGGPLR
ncbi:asparagine synthase (glutamine-hydrolyzing) [Nocardioides aequoreus]|uniref:asparagine synthase (glutamine-hydrolyzing) n=1 Tax=Nocardioides aequoreus TaxID=397278 RepID=UPI0004C34A4E|nr:asparagine synthase (glutamine-hydrolyzing) [Nocardioides aequoreus]